MPPPLSVATKERRKAGEGSGENLFESEALMTPWLFFAAGFILATLYIHRRT